MTTGSKPDPYPFFMCVDITCIYKWIGLQSYNHTVMKKEELVACKVCVGTSLFQNPPLHLIFLLIRLSMLNYILQVR